MERGLTMTSAGRTNIDGKVSRRLELVRGDKGSSVGSSRRFRIGVADNLFNLPAGRNAERPITDEETRSTEPLRSLAVESFEPAIPDMEIVIGLIAVAGLAVGYLLGKHRK